MTTQAVGFAPMAKPKGRPKGPQPGRDDVTVKIDREIVAKAKLIALRRNMPMAELLSDMLRTPVDKAYRQELKGLREEEIE